MSKDIIQTFATNLKMFRDKSGFSQEELAHRAGLHRTYIGSVERGERNISIRNIGKIAEALGLEPYILLMNNEE